MLSLEKRKLFKILEISSVFVGVIMALYYFYPVFASPPSTPYAPGETTDPTCSPGDTNCTVHPPLTTTLTTSTAIIMGTSSLRFAYDATNYTALTVATDGALTVSSTGGVTTTFVNKIVMNGGLTITGVGATTTNFNVSGILTAGTFSPTNLFATSITSTNAFFTSVSSTNATTTNLNVSSLANILQLGINSSTPMARLSVQGTANNDPVFDVASSTGASLLRVLADGRIGMGTAAIATGVELHILASGANAANIRLESGGGTSALIDVINGGRTIFEVANALSLQEANGTVGIGTSTPIARLAVAGVGTENPFTILSSTRDSMLTVLTNGNVGINSSTPIDTLGVQGGLQIVGGVTSTNLNVSGLANFANATLTSSTITYLNFQNATGTLLAVPTIIPSTGAAGTLTIGLTAGTGAITVGNSTLNQTLNLGIGTSSTINIGTGPGTTTIAIGTGGAFGGIHIGTTGVTTTIDGGLTITGIGVTTTNLSVSGSTNLILSGTAGQFPYYAANGFSLTNTSTLFVLPTGRIGIGTTTPQSKLTIQSDGTANPFSIVTSTAGAGSMFTVLTNGNVGINSSSPIASLGIQGTGGTNPFAIVSSTGEDLVTVLTNGQVLAAVGGGATPAFSFIGDSNTGIYGSGAGLIAFTVDGGTRVRIADAGVEITGGTSALPGLRIFDDTNTGIFGDTADLLGITTGGINRIFIKNTSTLFNSVNQAGYQIGINTSTPFASLAIQGASSSNPFSIVTSTAGAGSMFTVLTNGDVGINSSTPMARLSVQGTANNNPVFDVASSTGDSLFRVLADGRIGIGTAAPSVGTSLHILSRTASPLIRLESTGGTVGTISVNNGSRMVIEAENDLNLQEEGGRVGIATATPIARLAVTGAGTENPLEIASSTNASLFRILTNGNVGINSSSPIDTLGIQGGLQVVGPGVTTTNLTVTNIYGAGTQKIDIGTGITNGLLITASGGLYMNNSGIQIGNNLGSFFLDAFSASVNTRITLQNSDASRIADAVIEGSLLVGTTTRQALLSVFSTATNTPSFEISSSTGSSMLRVLANGNVGINSSSPSARLSVEGNSYFSQTSTFGGNVFNIIDSNTATVITQVSTTAVGTNPRGIFVSGRYAYVTNASGNTISVVDISNPLFPKQVTTTAVGFTPQDIYVSGRYAYVVNNVSSTLSVVDISNPSAPRQVSTTTVGAAPLGIFVSGRYAYSVHSGGADGIDILDISNPLAPSIVSTIGTGGSPFSVFVSGRFAYTANNATDNISIVDIGNPAAPRLVTSYSLGTNAAPIGIYVSGRYAYVANQGPDNMAIVDISNPAIPVMVASTSVGGVDPNDIFVSGRYAYLVNNNSSSMSIVDISSSTNPILVATTSVGTSPYSLYVSGRYAYVTNEGPDTISVVDISGTEVTSLIAHSAEVGNLQSKNDIFAQGNIMAGTGLNVGAGGIMSNGALSVFVSSTVGTSSIFSVGSVQTPNILHALTSGRIGIGTSTPQSKLTIQGNGSEDPFSIVSSTADATSMLTVFTNGRVGINTSTPMAGLSVQGTANNDPVFFVASSSNTGLFKVFADGRIVMGAVDPSTGVELHIRPTAAAAAANIRLESAGGTATTFDQINGGRFTIEASGDMTLQEVSGKIGIGTSTPIAQLALEGDGTNPFAILSSTRASMFTILTNGNVGVNSSSPMNIFSTQGEVSMMGLGTNIAGNGVCVTATGTITNAGAAACTGSSIRYKENLRPFTGSALNTISKLNVVIGNYKEGMAGAHVSDSVKDEKDRLFLIAEEVALVDPRLVDFNKQDQPETLNFDEFNALYARGLQELNNKLTSSEQVKMGTYPFDPECGTKGNCPQVGDVVCFAEGASSNLFIEKCSVTSTDSIIGVVSGDSSTSSQSVALSGGQVSVNVSAANGPIKAGDYLTSSAVPGVAVKAIEPGKVIGMALESFDGSASVTGSIKISVNTSWSFGSLFAADISGEMPNFASVVLDKFTLAVKNSLRKLGLLIKDGIATVKEVLADKVTTQQLCVGSTCVNEQQLQEILNKTQTQAAPVSPSFQEGAGGVAEGQSVDITESPTTTIDTSTTTLTATSSTPPVIPSPAQEQTSGVVNSDEGSFSTTSTPTT